MQRYRHHRFGNMSCEGNAMIDKNEIKEIATELILALFPVFAGIMAFIFVFEMLNPDKDNQA